MSSEIKESCLGEIVSSGEAALQTGPFGTMLKASEYSKSGTPVISVGEIREGFLAVESKTPRVPEEVVSRLPRFILEENDIVFGRKGSTHRNALIKKEEEGYFLGSDGIRLRVHSETLCPKFISYQLRSKKAENWLKMNSEGTTMPSLNQDILSRFPITILPTSDQKAIAHILGTLDDKIELNRKTNETLEGIAKALFKSWFVDFDLVRAKAEGRPTGLPDEISELFPDSFEESELGEIPSGWRFGDLNDLANLNPESWSAKNHPSELIYVDLSGTKNGTIEETVAYEWSDAPSRARRVLKEGDTIVGTVRPGNRSFSLIQRVGLTGSTGFAVIRPKQLFNASFLYVASTSDESIDRLAHLADGGAYPAVRPDVVMETPLNIPSEPVQMLFGELTDSLFRKISVNEQESVVLGQLRDALLPRLISGELRVPDAEKMLEEVGI